MACLWNSPRVVAQRLVHLISKFTASWQSVMICLIIQPPKLFSVWAIKYHCRQHSCSCCGMARVHCTKWEWTAEPQCRMVWPWLTLSCSHQQQERQPVALHLQVVVILVDVYCHPSLNDTDCSEKCLLRWCSHCADVTERTYTNWVSYKPMGAKSRMWPLSTETEQA
jgi:hypothetical protein